MAAATTPAVVGQTTAESRGEVVTFIKRQFERVGVDLDSLSDQAATTDKGARGPSTWDARAADVANSAYTFVRIYAGRETIGAAILRQPSDAVWMIELFAANKERGHDAMATLLGHAFPPGRGEFRVLCLEALMAKDNIVLRRFYLSCGFILAEALGLPQKELARLATGGGRSAAEHGGLDKLCSDDMRMLCSFSSKVTKGNRAFVISSAMFNDHSKAAASHRSTGTDMTAARATELAATQRGGGGDRAARRAVRGAKPTEKEVMDQAYADRLSSLTTEELDFVRQGRPWPDVRTSRNPMAEPKPSHAHQDPRKGWSAQRTRHITSVFRELDTLWPGKFRAGGQSIEDALFAGGRYDWLLDTAAVYAALLSSGREQGHTLTALMHLCEVLCGEFNSTRCFDARYKAAKMEYRHLSARKNSPPTEAPDSPTQINAEDAARGRAAAAAMEAAARDETGSAGAEVDDTAVLVRRWYDSREDRFVTGDEYAAGHQASLEKPPDGPTKCAAANHDGPSDREWLEHNLAEWKDDYASTPQQFRDVAAAGGLEEIQAHRDEFDASVAAQIVLDKQRLGITAEDVAIEEYEEQSNGLFTAIYYLDAPAEKLDVICEERLAEYDVSLSSGGQQGVRRKREYQDDISALRPRELVRMAEDLKIDGSQIDAANELDDNEQRRAALVGLIESHREAQKQTAGDQTDTAAEPEPEPQPSRVDTAAAAGPHPQSVRDTYPDGCPTKPYKGAAPTQQERQEWESAATAYYDTLRTEYQRAIDNLGSKVRTFLQQPGLDLSTYSVLGLETRRDRFQSKQGLKDAMAYFALATLWGDENGTYEPQRLDWGRAQFIDVLPTPLPERCAYVHQSQGHVMFSLRGGNKTEHSIDIDLTDTSPLLAELLTLWQPFATAASKRALTAVESELVASLPESPTVEQISAAADENAAVDEDAILRHYNMLGGNVIFQLSKTTYGTSYMDGDDAAFAKAVRRAWTRVNIDPGIDATKEWKKSDQHGHGCGWARTVLERARRGVVCDASEQRDDAGAAQQAHAPATARSKYRTM